MDILDFYLSALCRRTIFWIIHFEVLLCLLFPNFALQQDQIFATDVPYRRVAYKIPKCHTRIQKLGKSAPHVHDVMRNRSGHWAWPWTSGISRMQLILCKKVTKISRVSNIWFHTRLHVAETKHLLHSQAYTSIKHTIIQGRPPAQSSLTNWRCCTLSQAKCINALASGKRIFGEGST